MAAFSDAAYCGPLDWKASRVKIECQSSSSVVDDMDSSVNNTLESVNDLSCCGRNICLQVCFPVRLTSVWSGPLMKSAMCSGCNFLASPDLVKKPAPKIFIS